MKTRPAAAGKRSGQSQSGFAVFCHGVIIHIVLQKNKVFLSFFIHCFHLSFSLAGFP